MDISALWNDNIYIEWWKMLLIGLFFVTMNTSIFLAMWYVRRGIACEYGYPKRNKKSMKKKLAQYSVLEHLLLIRLTHEAERKGPLLCINLICHYISLTALVVCFCGFGGCMITLADGWALSLLTISELAALVFSVLIEFIPHLIWLPSERKRYKFR